MKGEDRGWGRDRIQVIKRYVSFVGSPQMPTTANTNRVGRRQEWVTHSNSHVAVAEKQILDQILDFTVRYLRESVLERDGIEAYTANPALQVWCHNC